MKISNFFSFFLFCALGSFLLTSCAKEATPSTKAEEFLTAMSKGEFEQAKRMVDDDSEKVIVSLEKAKVNTSGKTNTITIISEDNNGENATVKYKYGDNKKVNVIKLKNNDEGNWKVVMDRRSNDIEIGEESIGEILSEADINLEEILSVSGDAIEAAMNLAGKTLEGLGKILQDKSGEVKLNLEDSEGDIQEAKTELVKALQEMKINWEGSEEDIKEAKQDLVKALQEMKVNFEGSEEDIEAAKKEIQDAMKEIEKILEKK